MSSIVRHGDTWFIQWYEAGKKRTFSTGVKVAIDPKKVIAKQVQRDWDTGRAKEEVGLQDPVETIEEMFQRLLAARSTRSPEYREMVRRVAGRWIAHFNKFRVVVVSQIKDHHIQARVHELTELGRSQSAIRFELVVIRMAVEYANTRRKLAPINMRSWPKITHCPPKSPDKTGAYSAFDVDAILSYLRDNPGIRRNNRMYYRAFMFLAYTGCRVGEMMAMRVADFGDVIKIRSKKTERSSGVQFRHVPPHPLLKKEFYPSLIGRSPSDLVFDDLPKNYEKIHRKLKRICRILNIQYRRLIGFRSGFITRLLSAGVPVPVVMKLAGHSNMRTTQIYLDQAAVSVEGAVEKL